MMFFEGGSIVDHKLWRFLECIPDRADGEAHGLRWPARTGFKNKERLIEDVGVGRSLAHEMVELGILK